MGFDKSKLSHWRRWVKGHLTEATTAELADDSHIINTGADKVLGRVVYNTTTGVTVFASGNADGDTWDYYDATTAHTPV